MDAATVDLAIGLADEMNLGKGAAPDLLNRSWSITASGTAPRPASEASSRTLVDNGSWRIVRSPPSRFCQRNARSSRTDPFTTASRPLH